MARRSQSGWLTCDPSKRPGRLRSRPIRPIGPQRTYSIRPSQGSACGAINIRPPVYLLFEKVRKRQRRTSASGAPSTRTGNARRFRRSKQTNTPRRYPISPRGLNHRFVTVATSAGKPRLRRLRKYRTPSRCTSRSTSHARARPNRTAFKTCGRGSSASLECARTAEGEVPITRKSRRKELPVPNGRSARRGRCPSRSASGNTPLSTSKVVPSPPTTRNERYPSRYAARARAVASPGRRVQKMSIGRPLARSSARTRSARLPQRPPPAAGFTTARKPSRDRVPVIASARQRDFGARESLRPESFV
ncbi:hypothetical protein HRbin10_02492 [bacterium HR10]|nr:hypothetical protein HRbin10_02492 [bacterium HR10]